MLRVVYAAILLMAGYFGFCMPGNGIGTAASGSGSGFSWRNHSGLNLGRQAAGVRLTGNLSFHTQLYQMQSEGISPVGPRRPGDLHRLMINPVIQAGDFRLPLSITLSSRQTNTISIQPPSQSFGQYLRNPVNTFRIAPGYKWIKLVAGSQVVNYSQLITGDLKMFGAGFELSPGRWIISAFSGQARQAIQPDTLRHIPGQYARKFHALKLGYGQDESFHLFLHAAYMQDDVSGKTAMPVHIRPQEGLAASVGVGIPLWPGMTWVSEVAASVFTRDTRSALHTYAIAVDIDPYYDLRRSTRTDFSGKTSLAWQHTNWDVKLHAIYVGDGFVAPGYPYLETDRMDFTLDPSLRLMNNNLVFTGSFGYRINNLSDTRLQTTDQLLVSFDMNYAVSDVFGFAAGYSNFGVRTAFTFDTLSVEIVSSRIALSPYLNIRSPGGVHRLTTSFSYDDYRDNNLVSGQLIDRKSINAFVNYQFSFQDNPFTLQSTVNYLKSLQQDLGYNYFMIQGGLSTRFLKNAMQIMLNLSYVNSSVGSFSPDNAFLVSPGFRYAITSRMMARLDGNIRMYRYGSARPGTSFTENMLRTTLSYRL